MTTATQPGIEPGTPAFWAIALPIKLLGQVPLRPHHGAILSLSSQKNERKIERMPITHVFMQNPLMSPGAQPSGIPQTRVGRGRGENIFREHFVWVQTNIENVGHWHSVTLSIFLSFFRLEMEKVAP